MDLDWKSSMRRQNINIINGSADMKKTPKGGRTWFDLTLKEKKALMKRVGIEAKKMMDETMRKAEESTDNRDGFTPQ